MMAGARVPATRIRRIYILLSAVAAAGFVISSTLFVLQGGFGGGHGRFDYALGLLCWPWLPLIERLPEPFWVISDYLPLVLSPFVLNVSVLMIALTISRRFEKKSH
jgi:hypothetical protein